MLNKGVKEYGFDSWKNWFVFNSEVTDEEIKDELREIDIIPEGHFVTQSQLKEANLEH